MKWLGMALMIGVLLSPVLRCSAQTACATLSVRASVDALHEDLTLADFLPNEACPHMRQAAAQVSMGKAPRAGAIRVMEGQQIRALLAGLVSDNARSAASLQIPDRIVVRRAGATKSCVEIADFLAGAAQDGRLSSHSWRNNLECGAIQGIAEGAELELIKTDWAPGLRRWEFLLHCVRAEDCVPFMVSARDPEQGNSPHAASSGESFASAAGFTLLVKPGETAMLTWDQAGIRVTFPVTCLDAGGLGQYVRVRLRSTPQILRVEVVGARAVQVKL
ncbi:MAG: flagella basal body P-ring formation protein FlgA [Candidatus Sulfotelmatobacter sp.]